MGNISDTKFNIYTDAMEKKAESNEESNKNINPVVTGAAGLGMLSKSKDKIVGQKTLYHGTSKNNWNNIKKEGIKANKGGTGGAGSAIDSDKFKETSKGFVHVTGKKNKAFMYNRLNAAQEHIKNDPMTKKLENIKAKHKTEPGVYSFDSSKEGRAGLKEFKDAQSKVTKNRNKAFLNPTNKKGKTVKIKMDYNKYKNNFKTDPDEFGEVVKKVVKGKAGEAIGKDFASKGRVDINTNEIVGLHKTSKRIKKTIKNMPHYIKTNPKRFGGGVVMAGLGTGLVSKSFNDIKDKIYTDAMEKKAKSNEDNEDNKLDSAVTGTAGLGLMAKSKDKIIGQKTLYHGTSKGAWDNIKEHGMQANKGGTGGASGVAGSSGAGNIADASKGKVYLTGKKGKAFAYSRRSATADAIKEKLNSDEKVKKLNEIRKEHRIGKGKYDFDKTTPEGRKAQKEVDRLAGHEKMVIRKEMANPKNRDGKVIKVKMDYNKWKNDFELDPDETSAKVHKALGGGKIGESIGKDFAARTSKDVTKDEIVGLHNAGSRVAKRIKNLPNYIKTNPKRFGAGLAMAGAGGALLNKSIKDMSKEISKKEKKAEIIDYAMEKVAKSNNENSKKKDDKSSPKNYLKATGIGAGAYAGSIGTHIGLGKLKSGKISDDEIKELARQKSKKLGFADKDTIEVYKTKNPLQVRALAVPYEIPIVNVDNNEFAVRHELGHIGDNFNKDRKIHNKYFKNKKEDEYTRLIDVKKELDKIGDGTDWLRPDYDSSKQDALIREKNLKSNKYMDEVKDSGGVAFDKKFKKQIMFDSVIPAASALHSKTLRDSIRKKNDGRVKAIDKTMDVFDNPLLASAIIGNIKKSPTLRKEFAASTDATKGMVKKYGLKKGLIKSIPGFAAQFGSYVANNTAGEALKGSLIRGGEKAVIKGVDKIKGKASKKEKKAEIIDYAMEKKANILSKKDIYPNLNNTKDNLNLLVGFSGSGKTTLGEQIEKENPNVVYIEMDGFQHGFDSTGEENLVNNFIRKYGYNDNKNKNVTPEKIITYIEHVAKKNPDKTYLLEGVQSLGAPDELFEKHTAIIKGTGLLKSSMRRLKRDRKYNNNNSEESLLDAIKYNARINRDVDRVRKLASRNEKKAEIIDYAMDKVAARILTSDNLNTGTPDIAKKVNAQNFGSGFVGAPTLRAQAGANDTGGASSQVAPPIAGPGVSVSPSGLSTPSVSTGPSNILTKARDLFTRTPK